jgi:hypothetical protein
MIPDDLGESSRRPCRAGRWVDAHVRGSTSRSRERRMREHLFGCEACRQLYDRHLHLGAVDPASALPARARLARGLGLSLPRARAPSGLRWFKIAIPVAALVLCAVVAVKPIRPRAPESQARGGAALRSNQLLVYEIGKRGDVRSVTSEIDGSDGLAFAYVNTTHKRRLLIFAVDDARQVYWYHPVWSDARDDPQGNGIVADDAIHELPQAVTHALTGRRLQLFGVFANQALSVRDVEAVVARAPADARGRLTIVLPGAETVRLDLSLSGSR